MADYGNLMGMACPGALGDTSLYNIDGRCFTASDHDGGIIAGKVVTVKATVDRYKEISDVFNAKTLAYGVAFRSNFNTNVDDEGYQNYLPGEPINVVSHGRVWCLSQTMDQQPSFGQVVRVGPDGFLVKTGGFEIGGWHYTGGWQKWNNLFYIVEVQVIQSAPYIIEAEAVYVSSAAITAVPDSPQPNNAPIQLSVAVAPSGADDKTGKWSLQADHEVDPSTIATIQEDGRGGATLTPKGGSAVGSVFVCWTANDRGEYHTVKQFEFTQAPTE